MKNTPSALTEGVLHTAGVLATGAVGIGRLVNIDAVPLRVTLAERITPDNHKAEMRFVKEKVMQDHPALKIARHVVHDLSPACRDGFINAFVVNALLRGSQKRRTFSQRRDMRTPFTVLVSPTMRCNLHCEGCYASEYSHQSDMSAQLFQRIVDEAAEMGVYLITVLGGEPFMRADLLDVAAANPDTYFQVFSNGTLVRPEQVARIAQLGNVALMLSIEGDEATTDARRGPGTYLKLLRTMELLKEHGVLFGYSATVTRKNWETLLSDAFVDPLVARGAAISWHFLYMPVGGAPDVGLMPTPEQRNQIRLGIQRIRNTKAMFPVDFWAMLPGSKAASPANITCTSTTRAGWSPVSSRTSPPTTSQTPRWPRLSTVPTSGRSARVSPSTTTCSCPAC